MKKKLLLAAVALVVTGALNKIQLSEASLRPTLQPESLMGESMSTPRMIFQVP